MVEDDDLWRSAVANEAEKTIAELDLFQIQVHRARHCEEALEVARRLAKEGVLAICDLGLPSDEGEYVSKRFSPKIGLALITQLRNEFGCRVIALTTQDAMSRAFVALDQPIDDFLLKGASRWKEDLADRIGVWLRPSDPCKLPLLIPTFDRRIRLGSVWVELKPFGFAVVHALANATLRRRPVAPLAFGDAFSQEGSKRHSRNGISLEELKDYMCRVEVVSLPEDFMSPDRFNVTHVDEHLLDVRQGIREAFEAVHLSIDAEGFVRKEQDEAIAGEEPLYRLGPENITVVDSPAEFLRTTSRLGRPYGALVVEDDSSWRDRIVQVLKSALPGDSVVESAASYEEAVAKADRLRPAIVTLDLQIPRANTWRPENGADLRRWFMERLHNVGIVVLTSQDDPSLDRDLLRAVRQDAPRTRIRRSDIIRKADEDALDQVRLRVLRLLKECSDESLIAVQPGSSHRIAIDVENSDSFAVDGKAVSIPGRGKNTQMAHALLVLLGSYDNNPLRREAIFDYWREQGLQGDSDELTSVKDAANYLSKRVKQIRDKIEAEAGIPGKEILAEKDGAYWLQGFVEMKNA